MTGLPSAKKLGFLKGDLVHTGAFPAVVIGDVHTSTPLCEVFGFENEMGSAYAHELRHLTAENFQLELKKHGYTSPIQVWSKETEAALKKIGMEVTKR